MACCATASRRSGLPREIIDREVDRLVELGVRFETDEVVGRTFTVDELLTTLAFDAVFLGVGAGAPSFLGIPGENAGQVSSANEFLTRVNLMGADRFPHLDTPVGIGNDVVVVGAGNTAMDCLRVAKRLGARRVRCVYRRSRAEAPARAEELRHAEEEGIEFLFLHNPRAVLTDDVGDVRGMAVERMELGEPDERGRRTPVGTGEFVELDVRLGDRRPRHQPEPDRHPVDEGSAARLPRLCGGRSGHPGDEPAGRVRRRRHRHRRCDRDPRDGSRTTCGGGDRRSPPRRTVDLGGTCTDSCRRARRARGVVVRSRTMRSAVPMQGVSWRCTSCAKRSEGFAFPYGRCPACDGVLEVIDPTTVDGHGARDALRSAFEIELGGIGFYTEAASMATDPVLHDLFGRLAAMEREHLDTLVRRYHVAPDDLGDAVTGHAVHRAAVHLDHMDDLDRTGHAGLAGLAGLAGGMVPSEPEALLEMAIGLEERARAWFESNGPIVSSPDESGPDTAEVTAAAQLYRELAAEEGEHVALLRSELAAWRAGRAGLL